MKMFTYKNVLVLLACVLGLSVQAEEGQLAKQNAKLCMMNLPGKVMEWPVAGWGPLF